MSKVITPFTLRLPPELHQHVADSAAARGISMTREIVERLRYTFERALHINQPKQMTLKTSNVAWRRSKGLSTATLKRNSD